MRFNLKSLCSTAISLLLTTALCAQQVDECNHFATISGPESCFTYVLQGDQRQNINIQETLNDGSLDPWTFLNIPSCAKVTYDPVKNLTTVTICGAQPIFPNEGFCCGNVNPHFGLDSKGPLNAVSASWSNPQNACSGSSASGTSAISGSLADTRSTSPETERAARPTDAERAAGTLTTATLPLLSLETTQNVGPNPLHYTLFVAAEDLNGNVVGLWCQRAYTETPAFQITNELAVPVVITNAGFIANDVQRPLNTLDFALMPPPGLQGSPFMTPTPSLKGTVLQPGQSIPAPTH